VNARPFGSESSFKHCQACGVFWSNAQAFLGDPEVGFVGYQPRPDGEAPGLLVFNHARYRTRLTVAVTSLAELARLPVYSDSCPLLGRAGEFCLATRFGGLCPPRCVCLFVAHVSKLIRGWPKRATPY
jgi:hypothetical protein